MTYLRGLYLNGTDDLLSWKNFYCVNILRNIDNIDNNSRVPFECNPLKKHMELRYQTLVSLIFICEEQLWTKQLYKNHFKIKRENKLMEHLYMRFFPVLSRDETQNVCSRSWILHDDNFVLC